MVKDKIKKKFNYTKGSKTKIANKRMKIKNVFVFIFDGKIKLKKIKLTKRPNRKRIKIETKIKTNFLLKGQNEKKNQFN